MATIITKYAVGDVVWQAGTTTSRKQHPCPDCLGEKKWSVASPAGSEFHIACPRCSARYNSDRDLTLDYTAHVPHVQRLTIGSVQYNSAPGSYDHGARYMCRETGVGSGSIYNEDRLFETEAEALKSAEIQALIANRDTAHIVKLFNKTLEISDYELESAALKQAKDEKSYASGLVWNINDLFATIAEAEDKDAILEAIDDYKRYTLERDARRLAEQVSA